MDDGAKAADSKAKLAQRRNDKALFRPIIFVVTSIKFCPTRGLPPWKNQARPSLHAVNDVSVEFLLLTSMCRHKKMAVSVTV